MGDDVDMRFVLFLDCSEQNSVDRAMARAQKMAAEGKPVRSDDNEETLKKRFGVYQDQTMPIIQHYQALDKVRTCDANGDVDATWALV